MSTTLNDSMDNVKDIMNSAKHGTEHAVSSTRSMVLDGIRAAAGLASVLRSFGLTDALGWIGLARRRSAATSFALFGAGLAVGTGIGMLFAPMSGADTRRAIFGRAKGVARDAEETIEKAEAGARQVEKKVERKVEDLATRAKDAVVKVEQDVENAVTGGMETAKGAVKSAAAAMPTPGNHRPIQTGH